MSAEPKRLAALFFLPWQENRVVDELLQVAGATDVRRAGTSTPGTGSSLDCRWAGMLCLAGLFELEFHKALANWFWQSSFLDLLTDEDSSSLPLEKDGALAVALAFRDACEALQPEAACVVTHVDQARLESIKSIERMIARKDANGLADARFGLLYLNEELSRQWAPDPVRDDRDTLDVQRGRLVFANVGWRRWF